MKKLFTLFAMFAIVVVVNAQQFPNSNFEQWSGNTPTSWSGLSFAGAEIGTNSIVKSTDSHGGSYAMKLSSSPINSSVRMGLRMAGIADSLLDAPIPGFVTNGQINVVGLLMNLLPILSGGEMDPSLLLTLGNYITNGLAINAGQIPVGVSGYAKVSLGNPTDMAIVTVLAFTGSEETRAVCGVGVANITSSSYEIFDTEIVYFVEGAPVSELIFLPVVLTMEQETSNYSSLYLDDLNVNYKVGVKENKIKSTSIYPNPAIDFFQVETATPCHVEVINLVGKTVLSLNNVSSQTKIDINALNSGIYFVKMTQGEQTSTRKLIVQ